MFDFQQLAVDVGLKQLKLLLEESVAPAVYQDGVESDHAAVYKCRIYAVVGSLIHNYISNMSYKFRYCCKNAS